LRSVEPLNVEFVAEVFRFVAAQKVRTGAQKLALLGKLSVLFWYFNTN